MHRTVKGRHLLCRSAEVNGTKTKSLRYRCVKSLTDSKRTGQGKRSLLGSQSLYIGVLSDDFSAVDVREVLCYHSRPKKRKFKRYNERQKPIKRKPCAAEKRQPVPQRVSGDGSAPPRFRFGFSCCSCCLFRGVCLAAARVSAPHLSMPSTRHGAKVAIKEALHYLDCLPL